MKKLLAIILTLALMLALCCCHGGDSDIIEPVEFFYQRATYLYGTTDGVIAPEIREGSGHTGDLRYLLSLYLRGPLDSNLAAPFPVGCKLLDLQREGNSLLLTLDPAFAALENVQLTVACACLAKTCFSLSDVTQVQIITEATEDTAGINVTITADGLLLEDSSTVPQQTVPEESQ